MMKGNIVFYTHEVYCHENVYVIRMSNFEC